MKRDIFIDKIDTQHIGLVKATLILASGIGILGGISFLLVAIFYENVETAARILLYVVSGLSLVFGVLFPIVTLHLIKIYPKHRKITALLIKEYVFREYDDPETRWGNDSE